MRTLVLLREAAATTRAAKVPSTLVALLVAVMCGATLATVGRTADAETEVLARIEAAGSRVLVIHTRPTDALVSPTVVAQIDGLSITERAVGTTLPTDVANAAVGSGGPLVPAWTVVGDLAHTVDLVAGRWPGPGEALVSTAALETLGMADPFGAVVTATSVPRDRSVVGAFTAREPFGELAAGVVVAADDTDLAVSVRVVLRSADDARAALGTVVDLLAPPDPTTLVVESPVSLADVHAQVAGDLGAFGRSLLLGVLGVGALLVAVVVLADVLVRRSDLGRRRALGSTRGAVLALVVARTLLPTLLGAAFGTAVGLVLTHRLDAVPPADFVAGTAVLAVLAAAVSAVPPAAYAASLDPVRVLRTP